MNERSALVSSLLAALWVLLLTPLASAAQLKTQISAQRVGVGQTVVVQVTVPVGDGPEPSNAQLPVRGAADVQGPSVQSQRSIVMHNFDVRSETNVVYTWRIRPQKTGTLMLGPAQVQVGNATVNGEPVEGFGDDPRVVDLLTHEVVEADGGRVQSSLEGYGLRWLRVRLAGDLAVP